MKPAERDRSRRVATAVALTSAGVAMAAAAGPVTGQGGATVGGVVGALVLVALACAVWPWDWSDLERRHRELEAAWQEARVDAGDEVPWDRYAPWADPLEGSVEIALIRCGPAIPRAGGAPSPFTREVLEVVDAEEVERAATAIIEARVLAADRELAAQRRHSDDELSAEQREHEQALQAIDRAAAADLAAREAAMRREFAAEQDAERRAQAEALARALRQP